MGQAFNGAKSPYHLSGQHLLPLISYLHIMLQFDLDDVVFLGILHPQLFQLPLVLLHLLQTCHHELQLGQKQGTHAIAASDWLLGLFHPSHTELAKRRPRNLACCVIELFQYIFFTQNYFRSAVTMEFPDIRCSPHTFCSFSFPPVHCTADPFGLRGLHSFPSDSPPLCGQAKRSSSEEGHSRRPCPVLLHSHVPSAALLLSPLVSYTLC